MPGTDAGRSVLESSSPATAGSLYSVNDYGGMPSCCSAVVNDGA